MKSSRMCPTTLVVGQHLNSLENKSVLGCGFFAVLWHKPQVFHPQFWAFPTLLNCWKVLKSCRFCSCSSLYRQNPSFCTLNKGCCKCISVYKTISFTTCIICRYLQCILAFFRIMYVSVKKCQHTSTPRQTPSPTPSVSLLPFLAGSWC